ncbi:MAG TPA: hypothetical protein VLX58_10930 [Bryobacteraceae bacterium]|nr:hypothetical protein [Bryobacteraceae bacterium]
MSVWPNAPSTSLSALHSSAGDLVSISVTVQPRDLEDLLETLAMLDFPVNPQIYHDAVVVYVERDGTQRVEPATIVEFPAYASGLPKIHATFDSCGFDRDAISVSPMLDDLHSGERVEPAPPGAAYAYRILCKQPAAAAL